MENLVRVMLFRAGISASITLDVTEASADQAEAHFRQHGPKAMLVFETKVNDQGRRSVVHITNVEAIAVDKFVGIKPAQPIDLARFGRNNH